MTGHHIPKRELRERPSGYAGPNLSPTGLHLVAHELGDGVHALISDRPPRDDNGVIHGERATLIVDAGITPDVSRQIQDLAATLTDRPVRYLANTTYHGDHPFGNQAFPDEVIIVSSAREESSMSVSGTFDLTVRTPVGDQRGRLVLIEEDGVLSGTLTNPKGSVSFTGGTVSGGHVAFETKLSTPLGRVKASISGEVDGDTFTGTARIPLGKVAIEGVRVPDAATE